MKSFIQSTTKSIYVWVVFSCSVLATVYAASITGVTSQTISTWDTIGSGWFQQVNDSIVPSGAVLAFNLSSCPSGWSEYTTARGRTIIGAGNGASSNTAVGDIGGEKSAPNIVVDFQVATNAPNTNTPDSDTYLSHLSSSWPGGTALYYKPSLQSALLTSIQWLTVAGGGTAPDNMQPYVSLLYCEKN